MRFGWVCGMKNRGASGGIDVLFEHAQGGAGSTEVSEDPTPALVNQCVELSPPLLSTDGRR